MKGKTPWVKGGEGKGVLLLLALLLFLLSFSLRWSLVLENKPFWYDAIWTARLATFPMSLGEVVAFLREGDNHPPLSYLFYRGWASLLSIEDSPEEGSPPPGVEFALRIPSTVMGGMTAVAVFLVALSFGVPLHLAFLAGALYALNPLAMTREADIHVYPLTALTASLTVLFASLGRPWGWAFFGTLGMYTHYLNAFLTLATAYRGRELWFFPFALFTPWLLYGVWEQAQRVSGYSVYNGNPETAMRAIIALSQALTLDWVLVGGFVWIGALLYMGTERPLLRFFGGSLLIYLFLWLVVTPLATDFNSVSPKYLRPLLPLLFPLSVASFHFFLKERFPKASSLSFVPFLLVALFWAKGHPTVSRIYGEIHQGAVLATATFPFKGSYYTFDEKPITQLKEELAYYCRKCAIVPFDSQTPFPEEAKERGVAVLVSDSALNYLLTVNASWRKSLEEAEAKGRVFKLREVNAWLILVKPEAPQ